jgi:hypothetical protein
LYAEKPLDRPPVDRNEGKGFSMCNEGVNPTPEPSAANRRTATIGRIRVPQIRAAIARAEEVLRRADEDGNPEKLRVPSLGLQGEDAHNFILADLTAKRRELRDYERAMVASSATTDRAARPPMSPAPVTVRAPRRANGSSGRPRAQSSRSSAKSGDSGEDGVDDPPAAPPRGDGRRALLRRLIRRGLRTDAIEPAAQLILELDEYAATEREAVA